MIPVRRAHLSLQQCRQPVLRQVLLLHKLLRNLLPPLRQAVPLVSRPVQSQESLSVLSSFSAPSSRPFCVYAVEGKQHPRIPKNSETPNQISLLQPLIRKKHLSKSINLLILMQLQILMSPWRSHLVPLLELPEVHSKCLLFPSKRNGHMSVVSPVLSHPSRNRF